jgi:hypothetical protein
MASISIPSTIGGVTIPGTASSGPLGALFGSQYNLSSLQYPRDLGSMTKGHVVQFSLFERKPANFEKLASAANSGSLTDFGGAVVDAGKQVVNQVETAVLTPNYSVLANADKQGKPEIISLYMPDTVNFTNGAQYSGTSLLSALGETLGLVNSIASKAPGKFGALLGGLTAIPGAALSAIQSNPAKLLMGANNLAINPKNQLLFEGIDFRTYQMAFVFTPYSAEEARTVKKIIQAFKKHAAPRIVTEAAGMFFVPPSTVKLQFMYNGKENPHIARVAESVIESVDVNYSPNGWAAHDDGAPVQTMLTINFKEIQLIDRTMIEKEGF